jgi:hypothetical protein
LRIEREAVRKAHRHAKADAKKARKANVKRAGKWTEERRAEDKLKKLAALPGKKERLLNRSLKRAQKLEEQAKRMWAEAQKARARHAVLMEQRKVSPVEDA